MELNFLCCPHDFLLRTFLRFWWSKQRLSGCRGPDGQGQQCSFQKRLGGRKTHPLGWELHHTALRPGAGQRPPSKRVRFPFPTPASCVNLDTWKQFFSPYNCHEWLKEMIQRQSSKGTSSVFLWIKWCYYCRIKFHGNIKVFVKLCNGRVLLVTTNGGCIVCKVI